MTILGRNGIHGFLLPAHDDCGTVIDAEILVVQFSMISHRAEHRVLWYHRPCYTPSVLALGRRSRLLDRNGFILFPAHTLRKEVKML